MSFFDFLHKKIDTAEFETIALQAISEASFKEMALFIGISYIASTIAKCEIKTFEKGKEVQDELYWRLNFEPNKNQNSSQFWHQTIEHLYYEGEALAINKEPYLYCATGFSIDPHPLTEDIFKSVCVGIDQVRENIPASDAFYFRFADHKVKNIINSLYSNYGEIMAYALKSFKRSNGQKYKLILENYKAGDAEFVKQFNEVIKKQLESFMQSDEATYPQFKGTELKPMESVGTGATSTDIISLRKEIFDTTAQALKIPLPMMYGNTDNIDEIVKVLLTFCINPLAGLIGEEITRKHYGFDKWQHGSYAKVDTSCIKHVDILECADAVSKAIGSGTVNIDDLRGRLGLQVLNTDFSRRFWMTKNYEKIENMLLNGAAE